MSVFGKRGKNIFLRAGAAILLCYGLLLMGGVRVAQAADVDFDGIDDLVDNCQNLMNPLQKNHDGDAYGNLCEPGPGNIDTDGDGIHDAVDNCVNVPNPEQKDYPDGDGIGNLCEPGNGQLDGDGDLVGDEDDNCEFAANPLQRDLDGDGFGTVCDDDEEENFSNYNIVILFENKAISAIARMATTEASSYAAYLRAIDYETRTIESIINQRNDDGPMTTCGCHVSEVPNIRREILGEDGDFGQPSHHIVGSSVPDPIQCLACHYTGDHRQGVVKLIGPDNPNLIYDYNPADPGGIKDFCLACHDADGALAGFALTPFRDGETVPDIASGHHEDISTECVDCHYVRDNFNAHVPAHGLGEIGCESCHGHEKGYEYATGFLSEGTGTTHSHSTHTESDTDDWRGPHVDCDSCHDTEHFPYFKSGNDDNKDGLITLAETTVCDTCHSPYGSYDGINDVNLGAKYGNNGELKYNWTNGIYDVSGELKSDKEKWCATCHDEEPSVIYGISAPNVIGDESALTNYGVGYGFYKSGHGVLQSEEFPYSGGETAGPGATCGSCHDLSMKHIDEKARTYEYNAVVGDDNDYQHGYRLQTIGGSLPMEIPRIGASGVAVEEFRLCFNCHNDDIAPFINETNMDTNFRSDETGVNDHYRHLNFDIKLYQSDYDSSHDFDSRASCVACHNVHGSSQLAMVRDGELINKVPGVAVSYYNPIQGPVDDINCTDFPNPADISRTDSTGTVFKPGNNICSTCHGGCLQVYMRIPYDNETPLITKVVGEVGSNQLEVDFSEGVYSELDGVGALTEGDFSLVTDYTVTIIGVNHVAGENHASITLSAALDASDFGVATLAAATETSIYDGNNFPMDTTPTLIADSGVDSNPPTISDMLPADGESDVSVFSDLSFTLTDTGSGVDWTTMEVSLSGDLGYSAAYTDQNFLQLTKTGNSNQYLVNLNPEVDFGESETITVTVDVDDYEGNPLEPFDWSFTSGFIPSLETKTLHPSGVVVTDLFSTSGGTWANVLDSNDGDSSHAYKLPAIFSKNFYVAMDDTGLGSAAIQDITVHVVARYIVKGSDPLVSVPGTIDFGYKTGNSTVWQGTTALAAVGSEYDHVVSQTFTVDSDGGSLDLADIENLQIAVKWLVGNDTLRVTEVYVDVNYLQ